MFKLSRQALAGVLLAASAGLWAAPPGTADTRGEPPPDYAARVLQALNAYRAEKGLHPLQPAPALVTLAAGHSADMAARRRPSHDGFAQRFERTGAELCVENVAQGFRIPEQVLVGWQRVATHHRNVLEPRVRYVGLANEGLYVTLFACDTPE